jgi:hypothetical protein
MNAAVKSMNSLLPLNIGRANTNVKANSFSLTNTAALPTMGSGMGWMSALGIFVSFVLLFIILITFFGNQVTDGYNSLLNSIKGALGFDREPPPPPPSSGTGPGHEVTEPSVPPQNETEPEKDAAKPLIEKILPSGGSSEVFNVSKNTFNYYDAEPLCKALGAELATYEQVKSAWEKGADWCNYGWVKGQTAVYPTQKETWTKLQAGPEDQRGSCGVPGLNGGFFDNPEMRFGVNCYGPKPEQSQHDATDAATGIPMSPEALEINRKVAEFRTEAPSLGIMPFNTNKWSS